MKEISKIEFTINNKHMIQALGDSLIIFKKGNTSKPGIEIKCSTLRRILDVVEQQLGGE